MKFPKKLEILLKKLKNQLVLVDLADKKISIETFSKHISNFAKNPCIFVKRTKKLFKKTEIFKETQKCPNKI